MALFLKRLILSMTQISLPIVAYTDCKSIYDHIATHGSIKLEQKRLMTDVAALREMIKLRDIEKLVWLRSAFNLSDCLTKHETGKNVNFDFIYRILVKGVLAKPSTEMFREYRSNMTKIREVTVIDESDQNECK